MFYISNYVQENSSLLFNLLILNLQVLKDATQGSEPGKTISLYILDALICIDHDRYFLNQLQSRGFLKSCLISISNVSLQVVVSTLRSYNFEIFLADIGPRISIKD